MEKAKEAFYAKDYYEGLAPEPRLKEVAKIFDKFDGARLLDIGCGDGTFTLLLRNSMGAGEAFGVEIAREAVAAARKKGIKAYQIDIDRDDLPFDDEYFDVVYCGEIIEHVFDPDHLLEETHRVLRPEGNCVISTPNLAGWPNRFALLLGYQPYPMAASPRHESLGKLLMRDPEGQWGHIRIMTLRALKELLTLHGFTIRRVIGCPVTLKSHLSHTLLNLIKLVDRIMSRFPSLSTRVVLVLGRNEKIGRPENVS